MLSGLDVTQWDHEYDEVVHAEHWRVQILASASQNPLNGEPVEITNRPIAGHANTILVHERLVVVFVIRMKMIATL